MGKEENQIINRGIVSGRKWSLYRERERNIQIISDKNKVRANGIFIYRATCIPISQMQKSLMLSEMSFHVRFSPSRPSFPLYLLAAGPALLLFI